MFDFIWLRELIVALVTMSSAAVPGSLFVAPPPPVPVPPVVAASAPLGPEVVLHDEFDPAVTGPLDQRWLHISSSTPERTELTQLDGRSVLRVRPEGNLISRDPVPLQVGTTYRVTAAVKMPRRPGTHPSFWLRSHHSDRVGEIDVVESWGGKGACRVQVAFYWQYFPRTGKMDCVGGAYPKDVDGWHEYSAEFTYSSPGQDPATAVAAPTRLFVDGVETWSAPHSPVVPEYLRLQHKRNCAEAAQPSCGETGDGPSMYVDWVKVEVLGRAGSTHPPAGVSAVTAGSTGAMELHALDASTSFSTFTAQTALPLPHQAWRFGRGDYNGDTVDDLYAVDEQGSVRVLDGATGFQSLLVHTTVAPGVDVSARKGVAIHVGDVDGDGRDDLFAVDLDDGGSTSVAVLDAKAGFGSLLSSGTTALPALDPRTWQVAVGDHDNDGRADLHALDLADPSGVVAVHVLDARSGFRDYLTQTSTALPAVDPSTWTLTVGDHNGDGRADLMAVDHDDSGHTSVHVLDAASGFSTYLAQQVTALGATSGLGWQLF